MKKPAKKKLSDLMTGTGIAVQNALPYLSASLDPFLQLRPYWQLAFYSSIGLYGIYMILNQEDVNDIVRFINEHPHEFREEMVQSAEFSKGFLLFYEQYLKQRREKKKKVLKNI